MFLEYKDNTKDYLAFNLINHNIEISWKVVFYENKFLYSNSNTTNTLHKYLYPYNSFDNIFYDNMTNVCINNCNDTKNENTDVTDINTMNDIYNDNINNIDISRWKDIFLCV